MPKGMLIDTTACVGCMECVAACREANNLPAREEVPKKLDQDTFCIVEEHDGRYVRRMCMHCLEPSCVSACPVGALRKTPEGPVVWDEERCIGCRYCMVACPFDVPAYEWHAREPKIRKCIFCAGRLAKGQQPACAEACPMGATLFGERDELIEEAYGRFRDNPDQYRHAILGEREVGGTSMLFITDVPFAELGFPDDLGKVPLPELTRAVLSKIPGTVIVGGAFLMGMNWLTKRKNEIQYGHGSSDEGEEL